MSDPEPVDPSTAPSAGPDDLARLDIRVGTVTDARPFPEARKPAIRLWIDFGPLGVRVNAISPGEIDTAILSPGTDKIVDTLPLRRLGTPEEVAKAIYFLCTEQSSYVHGAEIHINGGQHV